MAIMKELSRFEITFSSMEGIEPGQSWSKELENAVQMADTFILVIGREFSRQQFVEAQIFLRSSLRSQENRERRIIPLMLSDATPTLPGFLSSYRAYGLNTNEPMATQLQKLVDLIRRGHTLNLSVESM